MPPFSFFTTPFSKTCMRKRHHPLSRPCIAYGIGFIGQFRLPCVYVFVCLYRCWPVKSDQSKNARNKSNFFSLFCGGSTGLIMAHTHTYRKADPIGCFFLLRVMKIYARKCTISCRSVLGTCGRWALVKRSNPREACVVFVVSAGKATKEKLV